MEKNLITKISDRTVNIGSGKASHAGSEERPTVSRSPSAVLENNLNFNLSGNPISVPIMRDLSGADSPSNRYNFSIHVRSRDPSDGEREARSPGNCLRPSDLHTF
ncbi:hypothetical protein GWI33_019975 [Rhynchophorus ferrugineus]|uniref:Uncharacterized protein n=1 Tax=Rhynchophorus ferrugineus TaxID=354439 RepID=A0A834M3S4_RHYFE|nr:hypothetical protein GWI33_019975 [Rhynchophorus ferrugineus]